ncbi:MAG: DUF4835 family protein [Crocinitomicaceae bacterium]|nr:DUF4835 family protein [Crocinitomicaceae bacterium]
MKRLIPFFTLLVFQFHIHAQELNCDVSIIPPRVMISGPEIFKTMETTIEEFLNNRRWTRDNWKTEERIQCTMQITIEQQINQREFSGSLQVGSSRPVYNSDYKTPILSINDRDFQFTFQENSIIQWSQDQHRDNLSSVLAFYANLIVAMDYDSFAAEGGTDQYLICQTIVSNAQNAAETGWRANEKGQQNRYWFIENIVSQTFSPIRQCLYKYHRHGMDKLYTEMDTATKTMTNALLELKNIHKIKPSSYNMQVFFYAKSDEIVNFYKPLPMEDKKAVYEMCKLIDPGNITKYEKIVN